MADGTRYRRFAEECVRLADKTSDPDLKAKYLEMAAEWVKLAIEAEAEKPNGKGLVS